MKKTVFIYLIFFMACKNKLVMSNMFGEDDIDIRPFISKGYKPVYCNNTIVKLIRPGTQVFNDEEKLLLKKSVERWAKENHQGEYKIDSSFNIERSTAYQYSYLILDYPVDVYKTEIIVNGTKTELFIRKDKGELLMPYSGTNWIVSSCD